MTAPSPHRLEVEHVGDVTVARFTDQKILDEQTVQAIREQLFGLVDGSGRCKLFLDFGGVEYLSSHILGELITLNKQVNAAGGQLVLCNIDPQIYEVFEITKLNKVFTITKLNKPFDARRKEDDDDPDAELGGVRSRLIPPKPSRGQSAALRPPPPEPE
jgi:anti-sigma B factor antagonist